MTEVPEDRVYARHHRLHGSVLIVGVGAVGSLTAVELAAMGASPLWLLDHDVLEWENISRHHLGAEQVGQSKALAFADRIRREQGCNAVGIHADFTRLPADEQRRLVSQANLVVAAADEAECQRRVNQVCLAVEKPAVFPGVWVDPRMRDAEAGEIQWVLPGRHTPCYACYATFRRGAADAQAARGERVDIGLLASTTARVAAALLEPRNPIAGILDPERTVIYVHGFTPASPAIRSTFPIDGLLSRSVRVPFPPTPCPDCGGFEPPPPTAVSAPNQDLPRIGRDTGDRAIGLLVATMCAAAAAVCGCGAWLLGHGLDVQHFNGNAGGFMWKWPLALVLWVLAGIAAIAAIGYFLAALFGDGSEG